MKLHIAKGLTDSGSGTSAGVIAAVEGCISSGASIVSMSLGGGGYSQTEADMYQGAYEQDNVLFVAAAGNAGSSATSYPASYPAVMSVGAVDSSNNRASFSQYNDFVEISGPGVQVQSTITTNNGASFGYSSYSGTSMATPHVAGVAGLVWSYNRECKASQIRRILLASSLPLGTGGCDEYYGRGLVQAKDAIMLLQEGGCGAADDFGILQSGLNTGNTCENFEFVQSCPRGEMMLTLTLRTDNAPSQKSWEVRNSDGFLIGSGDEYTSSNTEYVETVALCVIETYIFTMMDSASNSSGGDGGFKLELDSTVLREFGEMTGSSESTEIEVGCLPDQEMVTLDLLTDNYPGETTWELKNTNSDAGTSMYTGGPYSDSGKLHSEIMCANKGESYDFTLYDSYGDGICCSYGTGSYTVKRGEETVKESNGQFLSSETTSFTVPGAETSEEPSMAPSTQPSAVPSGMPSLFPSVQPSTSLEPSGDPSSEPSAITSDTPSRLPSFEPSAIPRITPSSLPSLPPSLNPSDLPSRLPSLQPSDESSVVRVTELVLVDAISDHDMPNMFDCAQYVCENDAKLLNVRAATTDGVKSMRFSLDGPVIQVPRVENAAPWSLFGDNNGDFVGVVLKPGAYTMTAEPFGLLNAAGEPGPVVSLEFMIAGPSQEPSSIPSVQPSSNPSLLPSDSPRLWPSNQPSGISSNSPSTGPSYEPSMLPSVTLTVSSFPSMNPSEQPITTPVWSTITYDDFESGWGSFADGGSDAARIANVDQSYIHQGSAGLRIRDGTGVEASVYQNEDHDVRGYSNLRVSFWFKARSMDNINERFFLEYSSNGGSDWSIVKTWARSIDFENEVFYNPGVDFNAESISYALTDQARVRFRCDASGNWDWVYIDEVRFEGIP